MQGVRTTRMHLVHQLQHGTCFQKLDGTQALLKHAPTLCDAVWPVAGNLQSQDLQGASWIRHLRRAINRSLHCIACDAGFLRDASLLLKATSSGMGAFFETFRSSLD